MRQRHGIWRGAGLVFALAGSLGLGPARADDMPLEALLEPAILAQAGGDLPQGTRFEFGLPLEAPARAERVIALEQDLRANAFAAIVATAAGDQITLRGKVFALLDVPVPTRPIPPGETVAAADLESRAFPALGLGRYALTDLDQIEGQEVRRLLPEGRVVQSQSLQSPRAVKRGEKLVLVYTRGPLQVTAPVRALEDAALGEPVRVQNLNSNKTIIGIARGDGRVEVGS